MSKFTVKISVRGPKDKKVTANDVRTAVVKQIAETYSADTKNGPVELKFAKPVVEIVAS